MKEYFSENVPKWLHHYRLGKTYTTEKGVMAQLHVYCIAHQMATEVISERLTHR